MIDILSALISLLIVVCLTFQFMQMSVLHKIFKVIYGQNKDLKTGKMRIDYKDKVIDGTKVGVVSMYLDEGTNGLTNYPHSGFYKNQQFEVFVFEKNGKLCERYIDRGGFISPYSMLMFIQDVKLNEAIKEILKENKNY